MRTERIDCGRDERTPGMPVSQAARMLVWRLEQRGVEFTLRPSTVLARRGGRVTAEERADLMTHYREVRAVLNERM
jgi:hypothetical protein